MKEGGISRLKKVGLKKKKRKKKAFELFFFGGLKMFFEILHESKNNNKNPILTIFKRIPFHFPDQRIEVFRSFLIQNGKDHKKIETIRCPT